jgi:hypothetical protein
VTISLIQMDAASAGETLNHFVLEALSSWTMSYLALKADVLVLIEL